DQSGDSLGPRVADSLVVAHDDATTGAGHGLAVLGRVNVAACVMAGTARGTVTVHLELAEREIVGVHRSLLAAALVLCYGFGLSAGTSPEGKRRGGRARR